MIRRGTAYCVVFLAMQALQTTSLAALVPPVLGGPSRRIGEPPDASEEPQQIRTLREALSSYDPRDSVLATARLNSPDRRRSSVDAGLTQERDAPSASDLAYRDSAAQRHQRAYGNGNFPTARHARHRARVRQPSDGTYFPSSDSTHSRVQAQCPGSQAGQVQCPSGTRYNPAPPCIHVSELCDGVQHCPNNEDEDGVACLFYKVTQATVQRALGLLETVSKSLRQPEPYRGHRRRMSSRHRHRRSYDDDEL